jgi:hypothetical protein
MPTEKKSESNFVTVECLLAFDKDEDKGQVLTLMCNFSSMVRFVYKRLMVGAERKELKKYCPESMESTPGIRTVRCLRHNKLWTLV